MGLVGSLCNLKKKTEDMRSKSQQSGHSSFLLAISCADSGSLWGIPGIPTLWKTTHPAVAPPWCKVSDFLQMGGAPEPHHVLREKGLLQEWQPGGRGMLEHAGTRRKFWTLKNLETVGLALRIFEEFHAFPEVEVAYLQIMGCLVVVVYSNCAGSSVF